MNKQVILIMTDTQRRDMVGAYGNSYISTPNIDSLANSGVRYSKAFCTTPLCAPSRSSIFTGTYPHTNCVTSNGKPLSPLVSNIGQMLSRQGIHSGYIGKWHLDAGDYYGDGICPDGFDDNYWYDMRRYLEQMSPEDRVRSRNHNTMLDDSWQDNQTYAYKCVDRAIDFLHQYGQQQFFLTLSFDEPHHPWLCPKKYFDKYQDYTFPHYGNMQDDHVGKPHYQKIWADDIASRRNKGADSCRHLLACNDFVDTQIGRFLAELAKYPCQDRTIIYTSDHGASFGAHGFDDKGPAMYHEITNIPLIFSNDNWGMCDAVNDNIATNLDIAPTVLDLFGVDVPDSLEGQSMLPTIHSGNKQHDYIFMEYSRFEVDNDGFGAYQPIRSVYDGRYKLNINLLSTDELYDTLLDVGEMNNLIDSTEHTAIRNALHDVLCDNMYATRDEMRGCQFDNRPWRSDRQDSWQCRGAARQRVTNSYEVAQLDYSTGMPITEYVRTKQL